jgi:hypothetical protein
MPLSKNDIRKRATAFAHEWRDAHNEVADAKSFWDGFLNVFGIPRRRVAVFEQLVKKLDERHGYIDLYWPGKLVVEHKSRGKDLGKAHGQAIDYLHGLKDIELPEYIIVSDFTRLHLHHLETGEAFEMQLAELPKHIDRFDFISGYTSRAPREQDPVNIRAAELMGRLHDELKATGYTGHALEVYLVRLLFILFADDTGIFENSAFFDWVHGHTGEDGSDLGPKLERLFQVLNSEKAQRSRNLDERLAEFPYVNGKLFEERLPMADWDGAMRVTLLEACGLDWSRISPAIFGALFQSVMDPKARRDLGAHYTSEANILKLIQPLFLDELWEEFNKVKGTAPTTKQRMAKSRVPTPLEKFHKKLSELRFLDPACGCGNFLVITYRELRRLEVEVIRALMKGQQVTNVDQLILLNVDQFYGIEIEDFPAQIAQVALWLTDHQMNQEISQAFGEYVVRIPLRKSATIANANALRLPWESLLKKEQRYDYILGNPPFYGAMWLNDAQREDVALVMGHMKGSGVLDFVSCWYVRAAEYLNRFDLPSRVTRCAFVSTNSITQGEQVGILWSVLLDQYSIKIHFAHRTFKWANEAKNNAGVHVVIIGFSNFDTTRKLLYTYPSLDAEPVVEGVANINPYLVPAADVVIRNRTAPLCGTPRMVWGNQPRDGGHLTLSPEDKEALLSTEPGADKFIRPFLGGYELINGKERYCLWLKDASPVELKQLPAVMKRVAMVRETRLASKAGSTRKFASTPTLFAQIAHTGKPYLAIPEVSSERRRYLPIGFLTANVIASNKLQMLPNASLWHFGVLTSEMHMAWMRYTCGRLESRFSYSNTLVYNNYPWPSSPTAAQREAVERAAQGVLDARAAHPGSSLADLYDPLTMPANLVKAHQALDSAVDKCYRKKGFENEVERVAFLFEKYEEVVGGLLGGGKTKKKRKV